MKVNEFIYLLCFSPKQDIPKNEEKGSMTMNQELMTMISIQLGGEY